MLLGRPAARKKARHVSTLRQKGHTARRTWAFLVNRQESAWLRGAVARVGEEALAAGQEVAARELGSARSGARSADRSAKRVHDAQDLPGRVAAALQQVRHRKSGAWKAQQLSASGARRRVRRDRVERRAAPHRAADGEHGVGHEVVAEHAAALCRALLAVRLVVLGVLQRLLRVVC
jgi:hypothetical protein